MNKNELAEFLKGCPPDQILVVTWNNILKILFTPFKVKARLGIGELKKNEIVWVSGVKVTFELKTVFIIKDRAYFASHFDILEQ